MPDELTLSSRNLSETTKIGKEIGALLKSGDVVLLNGELGAGKTTIAKAIATGLGIETDRLVVSPSYAIINEYTAKYKIYHFDFYRIDNPDELDDIGAYEYFQADGVCLIEWGDKFINALPKERLTLLLNCCGVNKRKINITAHGTRYENIINKLKKSH